MRLFVIVCFICSLYIEAVTNPPTSMDIQGRRLPLEIFEQNIFDDLDARKAMFDSYYENQFIFSKKTQEILNSEQYFSNIPKEDYTVDNEF